MAATAEPVNLDQPEPGAGQVLVAATFDESLECLRPRGLLVVYGWSSDVVAPVDLLRLQRARCFSRARR